MIEPKVHDEEMKEEEIIGVKIMSLNEAPLPFNKNAADKPAPEEESKAQEAKVLPDPKKKVNRKKALAHRDEGAF